MFAWPKDLLIFMEFILKPEQHGMNPYLVITPWMIMIMS